MIINKLYGRLLRIFSNSGIYNNNTNYTYNAMDIAEDLINEFFYFNAKKFLLKESEVYVEKKDKMTFSM